MIERGMYAGSGKYSRAIKDVTLREANYTQGGGVDVLTI